MQNTMAEAGKQANAKFKALSSLTNDVGGGGGGGAGGSSEVGGGSGGYDPTGGGYGKSAGLGGKTKSPGLAGMQKKFGSDNIGVAGDDIFEMITRRYQARDKADNFLKDK
ncbi:MAG: hypothetical protein EOP05_23835 [Proteobacteria bacterium]|nr:MAG: hypothetical protein EOP05_23835 [Pseudomonadota bacterium]